MITLFKEALVHITVNGNEKTNVRIIKDGVNLAYYSDNKIEKDISKPIKYWVEKSLFDEPLDVREVFTEEYDDLRC